MSSSSPSQQQQQGRDGYPKPSRNSQNNGSLLTQQQQQQNESPTFLKIPRIRLKGKGSTSSGGKGYVSPPQQSPTENKNNKFSYIENSHLVNPVMIQQQQQKMVNQRRMREEEQQRRYSDEEEEEGIQEVTQKSGTSKVLIKPKKLPNPIKESVAMQSIHRELLLNQKIGRSVLTHKTELQKALEKLATKTLDSENNADDKPPSSSSSGPNPPTLPPSLPSSFVLAPNKNEFQRILDARAKQIEDQKCFVDGVTKPPLIRESEFEKIHKRITSTVQK